MYKPEYVKMATASYGGYEHSFVDRDLDKYTCNICTKVLRNPRQTGCGQVYCESCLSYWFIKHRNESCPHCRAEGKEFQHFLDIRLKREIGSLRIHCTNKEEGCQWIGELGSLKDHLESANGCGYVEVECPNKCVDLLTLDVSKVTRKDLSNHLQNDCHLRSYKCEHCGHVDTYTVITDNHYPLCPEFPLDCPNYKCGKTGIKRKDMKDHDRRCQEEKVDCPYECRQWLRTVSSKRTPLYGSHSRLSTSRKRTVYALSQFQPIFQIRRKDLNKHCSECTQRPYQCQYCNKKDKYVTITESHHSKCLEFPLECPNGCGRNDIKRKDMTDHRSQCPEEKIECPNRNTTISRWDYRHNCTSFIKRKDLIKHTTEECILRPYECKYCGKKDIYRAITEHYDTCIDFLLECPNGCGRNDIKRKDMTDHRNKCPEEEVQCSFQEVGCKEKLVRRELEQHMSATQQQHLQMATRAYKEMKKENEEVKQTNEATKQQHNEMQKLYKENEKALKLTQKIDSKVVSICSLVVALIIWFLPKYILILFFVIVFFCSIIKKRYF